MTKTVVIGAGPSGLGAAYLLSKHGHRVLLLEADPVYVGGLSRTVNYKDHLFDVGGHRFYSKSQEVIDFWNTILAEDLLTRQRVSRIYFNGSFLKYPLSPLDTFGALGPLYSLNCLGSFCRARLSPREPVLSFEDWIINRFGEKLYQTFFRSYSEKVWGLPCSQISADWAEQRIHKLNLLTLIKNAFLPLALRRGKSPQAKSLIHEFHYPRRGPGQLWERVADVIRDTGGEILLDRKVESIAWMHENRFEISCRDSKGRQYLERADRIISSMPMPALVKALGPDLPKEIVTSSLQLKHRDLLIVAVIVEGRDLFPDNWLYIHSPSVKVGRIQNYNNWSPDLCSNQSQTCLALEYFCSRGDQLWQSSDEKVKELARAELQQLRLCNKQVISDACVLRVPDAYPVYDLGYASHVKIILDYLRSHFPELQTIGRNGLHRYNNQDHAVMSGFLAARNVLAGEILYDLGKINQEALYFELKE